LKKQLLYDSFLKNYIEAESGIDDIRAYPVSRPDKVWSTGGVLETYPLVFFDETKKNNFNPVTKLQPDNSVKSSFWRRLWKK